MTSEPLGWYIFDSFHFTSRTLFPWAGNNPTPAEPSALCFWRSWEHVWDVCPNRPTLSVFTPTQVDKYLGTEQKRVGLDTRLHQSTYPNGNQQQTTWYNVRIHIYVVQCLYITLPRISPLTAPFRGSVTLCISPARIHTMGPEPTDYLLESSRLEPSDSG